LTIFQERGVTHGDEVQRFEDMLLKQRELFAEEEVRGCFSKLVNFIVEVSLV